MGVDLFYQIFNNNYLYLLFWYWFTDLGAIFPTSFDLIFYYSIFIWMSILFACQKVIEKYVAEIIDP
jgi:hypothetical protein